MTKYLNQTWGDPISGQRLSTNGFYTGQHMGTVLQDASVEGTEQPYGVELATERYGTIMGDAVEGSMPTVGVGLKQNLTDCTSSINDPVVTLEHDLSITYHCTDSEKQLPTAIEVKIGGKDAVENTDYTWANSTGIFKIVKAKLTGDVEVTVVPQAVA